jgi:hypothetical protein
MAYAIVVRSKHTGDEIVLGYKYKSLADAQEYATANCCDRCNSIDYRVVGDDAAWMDKRSGFRTPKNGGMV